jgi:carboxymethylenebutenolidase
MSDNDNPGEMISFRANGRTADGYLALPPAGSGPGLIVIQEWWGLVGHIKDVTDRFAAEGFVALAPDLYHGETTKSPDQAGKLLMALNIAEAGKDMRGAARHLLALDAVRPKKVGSVGFCMGGQLALYAACEYPEEIATAVDFYGVHPKVEIDPQRLAGPVMAHFGRKDKTTPREAADALVERIRRAGKEIDAYFYDAGHAFMNDQRPEAYDEKAATLAWERTVKFLKKQLGA